MKNNKSYFSVCLISLIIAILTLTSCNELPTEVGYGFVTDTVEIFALNSMQNQLIKSQKIYKAHVPILNTGAILIGRAVDGNDEIKASTVLRFSNFPDSNKNVTAIKSVKVVLTPLRYAYGDSTANVISFDVHELKRVITLETSCDSLDDTYIEYSKSLGSFESNEIKYADTIPDIEFNIDSSIVRKWLIDQENSKDTLLNGIALVPNDRSTLIRQFSASSINFPNRERPSIVVYYVNAEGKDDTLSTFSANDFSFVCGGKDEADFLTIQGGTTYRSDLNFDVTSIPQLAAIHKAELDLTLNASGSKYGNYGLDKAVRADYILDTLEDESLYARIYSGSKLENSNIYRFTDLASAVEVWTRRGGKGTLVIRPEGSSEEQQQVDRLLFYGINHPDSTLRPKLRIIYSKRPDLKCNK